MNPTHSMMQSSKGVSNGPIGGNGEKMVENDIANFREKLLKTNNLFDNTTRRSKIITQNWQQYLPREIYNIMFPVIPEERVLHPQHVRQLEIEKEKEEKEKQQEAEKERLYMEKNKAYRIAKRTPGTKEWYAEYLPGKLWPEHPLSTELSLVWGLVQVKNSLHIEGFVNGIRLPSVTAFKKSCGKKSSGGGQFRKRSKNIIRRPCTGFSEVHLDEIKNWFNNLIKSNSDVDFYLPAAFINSGVDIDNVKKYKLFHVVPKEDFPLCKALGVLTNEIRNSYVVNKDSNYEFDEIIFETPNEIDLGFGEIMDLSGVNIDDDNRDIIDRNYLDHITRQACLVKAKFRQLSNPKEARKVKKNKERSEKMKMGIVDDNNELMQAFNPMTGAIIGYYGENGECLGINGELLVDADGNPMTFEELIDDMSINSKIINGETAVSSSNESSESSESSESDNDIIPDGITVDESYVKKENTHNIKGRFEGRKSTKKTARRSNKEIDDDFDAL